MLSLVDIQKIVDEEIKSLRFDTQPNRLYEPFKYVLDNGGKRIRPVLTLFACNLFHDSIEQAIPAALGLELFHNFTLLHDDIMDNADLRRNSLTVHKKWNENVAILSGDAMLIKAYQFVSNVHEKNLKDVLDIFSQTAIEVCEGQQYDMDFESQLLVSEQEYLNMIKLKTSVLLGACLKIGAIIGGADRIAQDLLYDFGVKIGLGFQIKDDYLDSFGDENTFGKKIGGDIAANKKTYLLIKALEIAPTNLKNELLEKLTKSDEKDDVKITRVKEVYQTLNIQDICKAKMKYFYDEAIESLRKINILEERKEDLFLFAYKLIERDR